MNYSSIPELAAAVDDWCERHAVRPMSGQAGDRLTERTLRYYRTRGLLDGPGAGGYGERHFLQLVGVRFLQSEGLPLARIQSLLQGRTTEELREMQERGLGQISRREPESPTGPRPEPWFMTPLDEEWMLVSRRGRSPESEQVAAIRAILQGAARPSLGSDSFAFGRESLVPRAGAFGAGPNPSAASPATFYPPARPGQPPPHPKP